MDKVQELLQEIGSSTVGYADAASAILQKVSASATQLPLTNAIKEVMGTNGIPDMSVTSVDQLIVVADAIAQALLRANKALEDYAELDDDLTPYYEAVRKFRATFEKLTDAQLDGYADISFFERLPPLDRKAAATVLIDIAVDRRQTPSEVWEQVANNTGGN